MKTRIINEIEKAITADVGKVLTNGGVFTNYPIELIVSMNDDSWYEIDETTQQVGNSIDITQFQPTTGLSKDELLSLIYAGL